MTNDMIVVASRKPLEIDVFDNASLVGDVITFEDWALKCSPFSYWRLD